METFYRLLTFIMDNLFDFIHNMSVFFTTPISDSFSAWLVGGGTIADIVSKIIQYTSPLGIYGLTPLELMLGVGLPICLVWMLVKWILPTS